MNRLMTHIVVGNPTISKSKKFISEMIAREVAAIELQIPFSDPIADGPILMKANDVAVENGVSVEQVLNVLSEITPYKTKMCIMSYLQPILSFGPSKFFDKATELGCKGYIIPDLPFDSPDALAFITKQPALKNLIVPVLSTDMSITRISELFEMLDPNLVYITARHGITGDRTVLDSEQLNSLIGHVRTLTNGKIAVGFGVQKSIDVKNILKIADLAVVGSALTSALEQSESVGIKLLADLVNAAED